MHKSFFKNPTWIYLRRLSVCSSFYLNKKICQRLATVQCRIAIVWKPLISCDFVVELSLNTQLHISTITLSYFSLHKNVYQNIRLTTVQSTSVLKLNLQPNSPKIQLRVNRLLLKKIIPTKAKKKTHHIHAACSIIFTYSHELYLQLLN